MNDFKELREALDVVDDSPEFVPGQWAIEPEMFEPDCLCDEDIAYIAAANPATIRSLLAELDAARRDAERYRWLREQMHNGERDFYFQVTGQVPRDTLDTAIDAAMKEQQP